MNLDTIIRRRKLCTHILAFSMAFLILGSGVAWSQVYVSPDGDDGAGGNGTVANPWLTLQKAVEEADAGDTIYIMTGNYTTGQTADTDKDLTFTTYVRSGIPNAVFESTVTIEGGAEIDIVLSSDNLVFENTLTIDDATVSGDGDQISFANIMVTGGGTLTLSGDVEMGNLRVEANSFANFTGTLTSASIWILDDGELTVVGDAKSNNVQFTQDGSITIGGDWDITRLLFSGAATTIVQGNLDVEIGITLDGENASLTVFGDLEVTGNMTYDKIAEVTIHGDAVMESINMYTDGVLTVNGSLLQPKENVYVVTGGTIILGDNTLMLFAEDAVWQILGGGGRILGDGEVLITGQVALDWNSISIAVKLTLNADGALDLDGETLVLHDDFENESGSTFIHGDGVLEFSGEKAQMFWPRGLVANDLVVTGDGTDLTTRTTLRIEGDFEIGVDASVILGLEGSDDHAVHIRMQVPDPVPVPPHGTFTNNGGYTSPEAVRGFVIIQDEAQVTLAGDGVFGNLDIREGSATLSNDILFSGIMEVQSQGSLELMTHNLTITDDFVDVSSVAVNLSGGGIAGDVSARFIVAGDAQYDLSLLGNIPGGTYSGNQVISPNGIRNLTHTATGLVNIDKNKDIFVSGTVHSGDESVLQVSSVRGIYLTGDNKVHTLGGYLGRESAVVVTGIEVVINGTENGISKFYDFKVDDGGSVIVNGLNALNSIQILEGEAFVYFNEDSPYNDASYYGGGYAQIIYNNVQVFEGGALTLDLGADDRGVLSFTRLYGGDMTLLSNYTSHGQTILQEGNLHLGEYNYRANNPFRAFHGDGQVFATTGYVILNHNVTLRRDFSIPNAYVTNNISISEDISEGGSADYLIITNSLRQNGDMDLSGVDLVFTDVDYLYESGSIDGTFVFEGVNLTLDATPTFDNLVVDGDLNLIQGGPDNDAEQDVLVDGIFTHTSGIIT
ncbi:hypothetical protein QLX67_12060, partial [Balneolaceae bacterium ANBcel3]|nr:hypothetical protein [Balneolaceae bacterium ANBcel3]